MCGLYDIAHGRYTLRVTSFVLRGQIKLYKSQQTTPWRFSKEKYFGGSQKKIISNKPNVAQINFAGQL